MEPFVILIALALALSLVLRSVDELVSFHVPVVATRVAAVVIAAALAWTLDYSAFAAFGQELRAEWLHPLATGLVLVGVGDFARALINAIGRRTDSSVSVPPTAQRA